MTITMREYNYLMRSLSEIGYNALTRDQQAKCDEDDNGTLTIKG